MNDPIETVIEATTETGVITVPPAAAVAVLSLATYGGVDLTRKAVRKVKTVIANRKANKAVENVVSTPEA